MAVKNIFPNTLGCNGIDGNRRHAEATEAAQAAWDRSDLGLRRMTRRTRRACLKPFGFRGVLA